MKILVQKRSQEYQGDSPRRNLLSSIFSIFLGWRRGGIVREQSTKNPMSTTDIFGASERACATSVTVSEFDTLKREVCRLQNENDYLRAIKEVA